MEDGISRGLQHCYETCCEKGGHCRRWACMVQRLFYHRDIVSGQVDLYMTEEMHKFINEQLRKGYIRPLKSPQTAPVFFVEKEDRKKRMVQDYRYLNE